ncbi:unnamed protein product [Trypanosoma congolense IL3000]|uniref:WGS project CAEQ00000000 data, annotated contig 893 n=1 Tax=Trypanosoma congolense (strain IL3000) TaxID=1068625 RepID=F9WJB5_TRYCI|nr:unnamed protein product [Trypanosoma congolense IL3000]
MVSLPVEDFITWHSSKCIFPLLPPFPPVLPFFFFFLSCCMHVSSLVVPCRESAAGAIAPPPFHTAYTYFETSLVLLLVSFSCTAMITLPSGTGEWLAGRVYVCLCGVARPACRGLSAPNCHVHCFDVVHFHGVCLSGAMGASVTLLLLYFLCTVCFFLLFFS